MSASCAPQLGTFGVGIALKKVLDYGFDYVLYPSVLLYLGYGWGGLAMTIASIVVNLLFIRLYDWGQRDILLLERLKEIRLGGSSTGSSSLLLKALRRSDVVAFFVLSWIDDPAVVTLYLRRGCYQYNNLSRADWLVFIGSTAVANLSWIVSIGSVAEAVRLLPAL